MACSTTPAPPHSLCTLAVCCSNPESLAYTPMEREKLEPKLKELGLLGKRSCFGDKLISPQLLDEFYAKVINTSHRNASHT